MRHFARVWPLLFLAFGCKTTASKSLSATAGAAASAAALTPSHPCNDPAATLYGDPGSLPPVKGAIIRCTFDEEVSAADLDKRARAVGYEGPGLRSGARIYRVLYRTERGTLPEPIPGYSVATVYLPTQPRAAKLPVVLIGRGSRGQAAACAPSLNAPEAAIVQGDFYAMGLPLVGGGYPVIAPDLAGYANFGAPGNPPSGYAVAGDVARSLLDGGRALRQLVPEALTKDVVLVGHSQGGHTVLAALALAGSYGVDGQLAGVVTYAPLWQNEAVFGAAFAVAAQYPFAAAPNNPNATTIWYHYTAGALYDGIDHAGDAFVPAAREQVKKFVESACWSDKQPLLDAMGNNLDDIFNKELQEAVGVPSLQGKPCAPGNALCAKWMARYKSERPHLDAAAAKVPLLLAYGSADSTLVPSAMACSIQRLHNDQANLSICIEPGATHGGIVKKKADYVNNWIGSLTLGEPKPAACADQATALADANGKPLACTQLPPDHGDD